MVRITSPRVLFAVYCLLALGCEPKAEGTSGPSIVNLQIQTSEVTVGIPKTVSGTLEVNDPDGDLQTLHLEGYRPDGSLVGHLEVPIATNGQTSGTLPFSFDFTADIVGRHSVKAWVVDAKANASNTLTQTFEAVAADPAPALSNLKVESDDVKVGIAKTLSGTVDFVDGDGDLTTVIVVVKDVYTAVIAEARLPVNDVAGVRTGVAPFSVAITAAVAGTHTIEVSAEDQAGHISRVVSKSFTAAVSTTAPKLTNLDLGNARAYVDIATTLPVAFDFADADMNLTTLSVRIKSSSGTTFLEREVALTGTSGKASGSVASEVVFSAPEAGRYTLTATLVDAAGERSAPLSQTFDAIVASSTAPQIFGLVADTEDVVVGRAANIDGHLSFTDVDGDVATLVVRVKRGATVVKEQRNTLTGMGGKTAGALSFEAAFTPTLAGYHTLEVELLDARDQVSATLTRGFEVGSSPTAPGIANVTMGGANALVAVVTAIAGTVEFSDPDANVATLHLEARDPAGAVVTTATRDVSAQAGQTSGNIAFSLNVTAAIEGRHTLKVWLVDANGETSNEVTRTFDALRTATTPNVSGLVVTGGPAYTRKTATLAVAIGFKDVDGNVTTLKLRLKRPNGTTLTERSVALTGQSGVTLGEATAELDVTPDVAGRHVLEAWVEDAAGQAATAEAKGLDVIDTTPVVTRLAVVYDSLFVSKASTLGGTVEVSDADANATLVRYELLRPDGSKLAEGQTAVPSGASARATVAIDLAVTPNVKGTHRLEAWVVDADGQTSARASSPVAVNDTSNVASACAALGTSCAGEGICYDVQGSTCDYFESHLLDPPDVCDTIDQVGTAALCVSSVSDPESPLLNDTNRCKFVQYWSYPTDLPIDCRCPEGRGDQRCKRPYETPQALSYGSGPRIRTLAATMQAWRGTVVGREWLLPVKWSTAQKPNETMIFGINLDTGNRRHFSGAWDDPANGYTSVGTGDAFVQVMDLKMGADGMLYAVGAASDIAAPKMWKIDPANGNRTKIFDEATAAPESLCPNFSTLPGRKTVQMATQGWAMDAQGRFYFSTVGMPGPSIVRVTIDSQGTRCEYVTRVMDCPLCSTQSNVGGGYSTIQFDFTAFEIVGNKLYAVTDKRFIEVDLTTGNRRMLSFASDIGAIGTGPINGEGLADRWTTWDPNREVFWTVGILGGSMAVTVDPTTGDRAAWPCFHDTRGVLEGCGGTGMALVPGPLNFGGMVIDPAGDHDLYFAHDIFSVVKYEVRTGNSYIFSL